MVSIKLTRPATPKQAAHSFQRLIPMPPPTINGTWHAHQNPNLLREGHFFYFWLLSTHDEIFCFEVRLLFFARWERWRCGWGLVLLAIRIRILWAKWNPFLLVGVGIIIWIQNRKQNPTWILEDRVACSLSLLVVHREWSDLLFFRVDSCSDISIYRELLGDLISLQLAKSQNIWSPGQLLTLTHRDLETYI